METNVKFAESRAGTFGRMNEASLSARPWTQPGYQFRPASQHDKTGHQFRFSYPYYGWVQAQVGLFDFTMYSNNDDGVAMVYHVFGPDSYESASVAVWAAIAPTCASIADIGAFTGLFAIVGQRLSPDAAVIAIEPNSAARSRLYMNMVANGCYPSIRVAPLAVSNELGTLSLHIAWGPDILDTGSSLHVSRSSRASYRSEIVTAAPIDVILKQHNMPPMDLMKIDVEGLEDIALTGATEALSNHPTLLLEIQDAAKFEKCYEVLTTHGYTVMAIDDHSITFIPYTGANSSEWFEKYIGARVVNFLCVARKEHWALAEAGLARIRSLMDNKRKD